MMQKKTYFDYMNEITSDELYEGLLAYGLLSEKLPPFLSSKPFFDYCKTISHGFSNVETQYIYYESIRNINVPRPLGIPNPFNYQKLCKCLSDNWEKLKQHFLIQTKSQDYKISRIHIRKIKDKQCMFEMNYNNWKADGSPEPDLLIGQKYLVKADISNCFPSIYSHALSWALVGKDAAKQERNPSIWYNILDFRTRNIKYGETHGLLIGPHASNLLSEIILTKIDKALYDKGWRYIRNIDDYTCYVPTYEMAQKFLIDLSDELRMFDLTLNHKKTEIGPLPTVSTEQWVRRINTFSMLDEGNKVNYKKARAYLDLAIELMYKNKDNSAILNYAIKVLAKKSLTDNAKEYCVKTIFHLAFIYPYLIPILEEYVFIPYDVDKGFIEQFANKVYLEGIQNKNYEAVSFAVYYALKYDFLLNGLTYEDVIQSNNSIFMLLAYLYFSKHNKIEKKACKSFAKELAKDPNDFNRYWLFLYEVLPQTELKGDWKAMKRQRVSFITF